MKKNQFDRATDILTERMRRGFDMMHQEYGKTNPYRKEPVPPKDRLFQYSQLDPSMLPTIRQQLGPDVVDPYVAEMEALRQKYQGGQ